MLYTVNEDNFKNFETANMLINDLKSESCIAFNLSKFYSPTQTAISLFIYTSCYLFLFSKNKIVLLNTSDYFLQIMGRYQYFQQIFDIDMPTITILKKEVTITKPVSYLSHSYIFYSSNIPEHSSLCMTMRTILNNLLKATPKVSSQLFDVIKELLGNALEHSVISQTIDLSTCGRYITLLNVYKSNKSLDQSLLDIKIFDAGIGIRYNIENTFGTLSSKDFIYISEAIKPGVTSRKSNEGGSGLSSTIDIFTNIPSDMKYLEIISGHGRYIYQYPNTIKNSANLSDILYEISGTYINMGIII